MIRFALMFAGSAAILKLLGFFLSLWVARTLITEQYGIWGLAFAIQVGIGTFGLVGIQESLVGLLREYPGQSGRVHLYAASMEAFLVTLAITLVVSLGVIFVALDWDGIGAIGYVGVVVSGSLMALTTLQAQIARLEEDHRVSLTFSFLIPLAGVAGSALAFKVNPSVDAFFAGSGLCMLLSMVIFYRRLRGITPRVRDVTDARSKLLRRITPFILVAFFGWLTGYGSTFLVENIFSLEDVAKLTFLLMVGSVIQLLMSALHMVWAPRFYRSINSNQDKVAVDRFNQQFYSIQSLALGAFSAICIAGMPYLLDYAGGQLITYRNTQIELLFIFTGYIVLVPWVQCQSYLLVYDKGRTLMYVVILSGIVGMSVWLILMAVWGVMGIYVGFFIQMILRSIAIAVSVRQWSVRVSWGATFGGIALACTGLLFKAA